MDIVIAKNLSKHYDGGKIRSVDNVSFTLPKGSIVALLGANGAGKSTTIKMLTGLVKPTAGLLSILGNSYVSGPDAIKRTLGYVPEESSMYEDIGIFDYLWFFANIYEVPKKDAQHRISSLLSRLDLHVGNRIIGDLSKGMKRKVLIARSLLHDPDLLIYDEPASGLDPKTSRFILDFMLELKRKGKTILFSSHHLRHVEQVADTVLIMHKGKLVTNKTLQQLVMHSSSYVVHYTNGDCKVVDSLQDLKVILEKDQDIIDHVQHEQRTLEDVFLELTR